MCTAVVTDAHNRILAVKKLWVTVKKVMDSKPSIGTHQTRGMVPGSYTELPQLTVTLTTYCNHLSKHNETHLTPSLIALGWEPR